LKCTRTYSEQRRRRQRQGNNNVGWAPPWSPHLPLGAPYWQSRSAGDKQIAGAAVQRKTTIMRRTQVSFFVCVLVYFLGLCRELKQKPWIGAEAQKKWRSAWGIDSGITKLAIQNSILQWVTHFLATFTWLKISNLPTSLLIWIYLIHCIRIYEISNYTLKCIFFFKPHI